MTEKRFHQFMLQPDDATVHFGVKDSETDKWHRTIDGTTSKELTNLLNTLNDENKELKQAIDDKIKELQIWRKQPEAYSKSELSRLQFAEMVLIDLKKGE